MPFTNKLINFITAKMRHAFYAGRDIAFHDGPLQYTNGEFTDWYNE